MKIVKVLVESCPLWKHLKKGDLIKIRNIDYRIALKEGWAEKAK